MKIQYTVVSDILQYTHCTVPETYCNHTIGAECHGQTREVIVYAIFTADTDLS